MNYRVSIKNILIAGLAFITFLNIATFMYVGPKPMYDFLTLTLMTLYCGVLGLLVKKASDELLPFVGIATLFFVVFIFSRTFSFLGLSQLVAPMLNFPMSALEVNKALAYIGAGTTALFLGHVSVLRFLRSRNYDFSRKTLPVKPGSSFVTIAMFLIICGAQIYISVFLGNSVLGDLYYGAKNIIIGILAVLFYTDMAFLVAIVVYTIRYLKNEKIQGPFVVLLLLYMCALVIFGSRQGGLAISQHVLLCMLFLIGNFKESVKTYLIFFISIVLMTLVSFPIGTAIRTAMLEKQDQIMMMEGFANTAGVPKEIFENTDWAKYVRFNPSAMLNRMNVVDTVALTLTLKPNEELRKQYLNVPYSLKSAINSIVPGTVFDNANITTALVWPFMYEARELRYLYQKNYYESFYWTAWGLAYILFGIGFGLVFLFFMGALLQSLFILLNRYFGEYRYYYGTWFLYNTYAFYGNMGIDHWLVVFQKTFVTMSVALFVKFLLSKLEELVKVKFSRKENTNIVGN